MSEWRTQRKFIAVQLILTLAQIFFPLFHTHSIAPYHIIPTCRIGSGQCV